MKLKLFLAAATIVSLAACGGQGDQTSDESQKENTAQQASVPKGKMLIDASDCMGCHTLKTKIIGPSYVDVAQKYPDSPENVKLLAGKIIEGGKGVWGDIPMTPHPQISQADAEEMVNYILSLE